tara:strand:+ start:228 stop:509 length:282 start_codon:yes stop_codon:yes gene_type:complete
MKIKQQKNLKMIEKLKELEQEAMDNLTPEEYETISEDVMDDYQRPIYQTGYIDGLQTAIKILHEEIDDTREYSIEMDDIFGDFYDENGDEIIN